MLLGLSSFAQVTTDEIFKAMSDEMDRSMNELKYEDYEQPFFMTYSIEKCNSVKVVATLGSLLESYERPYYNYGTRLIVGDYQLNDEKFSNKVSHINHNDGYIGLPKEPDYESIRRSLWLSTNNIYKSASEKYANKISLMEQNNFDKTNMHSFDFAEAPVVTKLIPELPHEVDREKLESLAKSISEAFKSNKNVIESDVQVEYQNKFVYFLNSEGTKTTIPFRFYLIRLTASVLNAENDAIKQKLEYYANSFIDLPNEAELIGDAELLMENLNKNATAERFNESYTGPVLITGAAVSELAFKKLISRGNGLVAEPRGLVFDKQRGLFLANYKTWEDLKGRKVLDTKLSAVSYPFLKEYQGIKTLGTFDIDMEGVVPTDSLILISDGKLKSQFNGRTPTPSQPASYGRNKFYINGTSSYNKIGPDILHFTSTSSLNDDELDKKLIELSKEEGLDYVIVARTIESNANLAPVNIYKRSTATGEETLLRSVNYNPDKSKLKKIEAVGNKEIVNNTLVPDQKQINARMKRYERAPQYIKDLVRAQMGTQGTPTTFIAPNAILFNEVEITGAANVMKKQPKVVPNPLADR